MSHSATLKESIAQFVIKKIALRTGKPIEELSGETLFSDIGIDSLKAVLICGYLEDELEIEIDPSVMFKYQTPNQVAEALVVLVEEA